MLEWGPSNDPPMRLKPHFFFETSHGGESSKLLMQPNKVPFYIVLKWAKFGDGNPNFPRIGFSIINVVFCFVQFVVAGFPGTFHFGGMTPCHAEREKAIKGRTRPLEALSGPEGPQWPYRAL